MKHFLLLVIFIFPFSFFSQNTVLEQLSFHHSDKHRILHYNYKLSNEYLAVENLGHEVEVYVLENESSNLLYKSKTLLCDDNLNGSWDFSKKYLVFLFNNEVIIEHIETGEIEIIQNAFPSNESGYSITLQESVLLINAGGNRYLYDIGGKKSLGELDGHLVAVTKKYIYISIIYNLIRVDIDTKERVEVLPSIQNFPSFENYTENFMILEVEDEGKDLAIVNLENDSLFYVENGIGNPRYFLKIDQNRLGILSDQMIQNEKTYFWNISNLSSGILESSHQIKNSNKLMNPVPLYSTTNRLYLTDSWRQIYFYNLINEKLSPPQIEDIKSINSRSSKNYVIYKTETGVNFAYNMFNGENILLNNDSNDDFVIVNSSDEYNYVNTLKIGYNGLEYSHFKNGLLVGENRIPENENGLDITGIYKTQEYIFTVGKTTLQILDNNEPTNIREIDFGRKIYWINQIVENKVYFFMESDSLEDNEPLWKDFVVFEIKNEKLETIWKKYTYEMDLFNNYINGDDRLILLRKGFYNVNTKEVVKYNNYADWEVNGLQSGNYYYSHRFSDTSHPDATYKQKIKIGSPREALYSQGAFQRLHGDVLYSLAEHAKFLIYDSLEMRLSFPSFLKSGLKMFIGNESNITILSNKNKIAILEYKFPDKVNWTDSIFLKDKSKISNFFINNNNLCIVYSDSINITHFVTYNFASKKLSEIIFNSFCTHIVSDTDFHFFYSNSNNTIFKLDFDLNILEEKFSGYDFTSDNVLSNFQSINPENKYYYFTYGNYDNFIPLIFDKVNLDIEPIFDCQKKNQFINKINFNALELEQDFYFLFHDYNNGYQFYKLNKEDSNKTSDEQIGNDFKCKLTPNPVADFINIEKLELDKITEINAFDLMGVRYPCNISQSGINVIELNPGLYHLELKYQTASKICKLLKI